MTDVLVVDDDMGVGETVLALLKQEGFSCTYCPTPMAAIEKLIQGSYRVLVTDMKMPQITGLELLIWAKQFFPDLRSLMMTAYPTESFENMALAGGAVHILRKPFPYKEFIRQIRLCMLPGMSSEINRIQIGDLLQILSLDPQRHTLEIQDSYALSTAHICLEGQRLIYAEWIAPHEHLLGWPACAKILGIQQGSFKERTYRDLAPNLDVMLQDALLKAATEHDESTARMLKHVGGNLRFDSIVCVSRQPEKLATLLKILENQQLSVKVFHPEHIPACAGQSSVLFHLLSEADRAELDRFCQASPATPVVILSQLASFSENTPLPWKNVVDAFAAPWPHRRLSALLQSFHQTGLSGYLSNMGLLSQLQLFLMGNKPKRISVKNLTTKSAGTLFFDKGRLLEAQVDGLTGEPAFYALTQAMSGVVMDLEWVEPPSRSLENTQPFRLFMNASRDFADLGDMQKFIVQKVESQMQARTLH
ncbi:MAG: response regulator [Candidatus Sericytochromatia bacterium]